MRSHPFYWFSNLVLVMELMPDAIAIFILPTTGKISGMQFQLCTRPDRRMWHRKLNRGAPNLGNTFLPSPVTFLKRRVTTQC